MTISAVITTYNRRELLREALASVRAQTRPPDEIVILDDGSTDGTREEMAVAEGVKYHWQPNAGTSCARNSGWKIARSEWIAYLDSDDLWEKEKLAWQEASARENPEAEAVFGHAANFASPGTEEMFTAAGHRIGLPLPAWLPGAGLVRRSVLERMGGFDAEVKSAEVIDWMMRLRQAKVPMVMLPQIVMRRRLHGANKRLESDGGRRDNMALIHRWQEQRREREKRGK
jgi:glycosyltransferase involved in cell wall biosynthesis